MKPPLAFPKNFLLTLFFLTASQLLFGQAPGTIPFVTTWETTTNEEAITIPTTESGYSYSYTVDWGDGSGDEMVYTGDATHTYATAGTYTVSITGDFPQIYFNNSGDKVKIKSIESWGNIVWRSMTYAFAGCSELTCNATNAPNLSSVTDLSYMFLLASVVNADFNNWDVSNVTNLTAMFSSASLFNGDVSDWDVSNVTDLRSMFSNASLFNGDLSKWNVSAATNIRNMFSAAHAFNSDISKWDVSSVTNMNSLFSNASSFNSDLNDWDVSSVTTMQNIFFYASAFNGDISSWDVSGLTYMGTMFANATSFNGDLSSWNVSAVTDMRGMFSGASSFNRDLNNWDVSNVTTLSSMFSNATSFNGNVSGWDVSNVITMDAMFSNASSFNGDLSSWNIVNVVNVGFMFSGASSFDSDLNNWDVSNLSSTFGMFKNATSFDKDLAEWDISSISQMNQMFDGSGLSSANYEKTLLGWASLSAEETTVPTAVPLGAVGLFYCNTDVRAVLIGEKNWVISGDTQDCPPLPDQLTLPVETGVCEVTAPSAPTATYGGDEIIGTTDVIFPIASTTEIKWRYEAANGNFTIQSQQISITDDLSPTPDLLSLSDITAGCEVSELTSATATDNCSTVTVTNDAELPITTQGTTVITWTYTDDLGNSSTQTQNVVIADISAPVADKESLADITAECDVTELTMPTATDNCSTVTVTNNAELPITTQGTTVVTWTFTDAVGNTSTQAQNIVITDAIAPVPEAVSLEDINAECEVASLTPPTATDNCGAVTVTNDAELPVTAKGITVITWTYTDAAGNSSTQTQNVVIADVTPPVPVSPTLPTPHALCQINSLGNPHALDNCSAVTVTGDAVFPITASTTVTWTYTDDSGNSSTQTQNVFIFDFTPPVADVESLTDITAACEVTELETPSASDDCSTVTITNDAIFPITASTSVTWTYTDDLGNSSTQTQNVVITDATAPVADEESLADVTAECEVTELTTPTATDNCSTVTVTSDATLPIAAQGTTVVTWTYTDEAGNTSTQTQNVVIADISAPVADVQSLTNVTAQCEVTELTTPTATDNCSTVTVTSDTTLPITKQGTTVVTWIYTDKKGNASTQKQNIVITDTTAPAPDAASLPPVTAACQVTSLVTPTAKDNCGVVTVTNDAVFPITASTSVTWTYTDVSGNTSTQTQSVVLSDIIAPIAASETLADVTSQCEITSLATPVATDNCGTVTVTHDATLPITAEGTTVVTWTYTDTSGNTSTQTQKVIIADETAPFLAPSPLPDITAECELTELPEPAATDNCSAVTVTNDVSLPITEKGLTIVTWTYTDASGNTSHQLQNVMISCEGTPVPTGVADHLANDILLYPNPSQGMFQLTDPIGLVQEVMIFDMSGRNVMQSKTNPSGYDISQLPAGIYSVNLILGDRIATARFIKN
ncbi:MAG: BspA family leucine-rich repeat surface protein [Imperialibacter sp.]|uniref:BspA family leucine-rich repeat surface protein n=1 Tax=Imperialibacter sp. TaxID=2038411 RepID=UPI0032F03759